MKAVDTAKRNRHYRCIEYDHDQEGNICLVACGIENCDPGVSFGPEIRDCYHLHAILSGRGTLLAGGKEFHPHFGQMLFHFIRLVFPHRSHSSWPSRIFQSSLIGFSMMWWQSWQINASRKTAKPGPNDNSSVSNPHLSHINIADAPISIIIYVTIY